MSSALRGSWCTREAIELRGVEQKMRVELHLQGVEPRLGQPRLQLGRSALPLASALVEK